MEKLSKAQRIEIVNKIIKEIPRKIWKPFRSLLLNEDI